MNTNTIDNPGLFPIAAKSFERTRTDLGDAQRAFSSVLGKHVDEPSDATPEQRARQSAEQLVSISLVQPMLKQLRSGNNAAPPFAPTEGEKQFRALTDADLAQKIVHAKQFPLVDRLAHELLIKGERLASGRSVQEELSASRTPERPKPVGVNAVAR